MLGIAWIAAIAIAMSIHEFAHALMADRLGDGTPRALGRLTLNPLAHVDRFGFLMLLLVGFGWGRPVPFDPRNLRAPRWGPAIVGLAGPFANIVAVVASGIAIAFIDRSGVLPPNNLLVLFLAFLFQINLVLFLFNLIPIPPLDGSKLLFGVLDHPRHEATRFFLETRGPMLLLGLIIVDSVLGGAILGRLFHGALRWAAALF